jgi:hypothetical protein
MGNNEVARPVARRPYWSTSRILPSALAAILTTSLIVFRLSAASFIIEFQLSMLALACLFFGFLAAGLYRGARLERPFEPPGRKSVVKHLPNVGGVSLDGLDIGDGGAGCLVALVVLVLAIVMAVLALEVLLLVLPPVLFSAYLACDRALRIAFVRSRRCRGNLRLSLGHALWYTAVCAAVAFAAMWSGWLVARIAR